MKKIYYLFLILSSFTTNAQLKKIKAFPYSDPLWAGRTVNPASDGWKNMFFYQGVGNTTYPQPLMVTDGTAEGTKIVKTFPTSTYSGIQEFKSTEHWMYFTVVNNVSKKNELWRTDGTGPNTIKIDETISISSPLKLQRQSEYFQLAHGMNNAKTDLNGYVYYFKDNKLYRTNGEVGGEQMLLENARNYGYYVVSDGAFYFSNFNDGKIYKHDGEKLSVFFSSYNDRNGTIHYPEELLGGTAGKIWVKGILNSEECVFSIDQDGNAVKEYGVSHMSLIDYNYVSGNYNDEGFYIMMQNVNNNVSTYDILYFTDQGLKHLILPHTTDVGSAQITKDNIYIIHSNENDSSYTYHIKKYTSNLEFISESTTEYRGFGASAAKIGSYQNSVWFQQTSKKNGVVDIELWRSDGTVENTREVFNIDPNYSSSPANYFTLNGKLYFFATTGFIPTLYEYTGDYTFNNNYGNNSWNRDENWNSGLAPSSVDNAIIPNSFQPEIKGNAAVNNLVLNSPMNLSEGSLQLFGQLQLNAQLQLNNGDLILKGNSSTIKNGDENNYIITNGNNKVVIESLSTKRGIVDVPIGTMDHFNPVKISNFGTEDRFSIGVSEGISNTNNGAVKATWNIEEGIEGGSKVNLFLGWNSSQHNDQFVLNKAKVGHYIDGVWKEESSGVVSGTNPYGILASGISSFSPFSVMNFDVLSTLNTEKNKMMIYPSPFESNFSVDVKEESEFRLYHISGREVLKRQLIKGKNDIQASSLEKGVYIYLIKGLKSNIDNKGKILKK